MNIAPINNTNFQSNYKKIKAVKNVTCACCDGKMIDGLQLNKAYASTAKPLLTMIKKGYMDKWADKMLIWNTLLKYAQQFPKASYDKIFSTPETFGEIKKAVKLTLKEEENFDSKEFEKRFLEIQAKLTNSARANMGSAKSVLKRFSVFRECLKEDEKEIFDLLEYYSSIYPKSSLNEIVNKPEILQFHKDLHIKQKEKNRRLRNLILNKIDKMIAKTNPDAVEHFKQVRNDAYNLMLRDFDLNANLYDVKKLYKEELKKNGCEKIVNKVMDELKQMPLKNHFSDSFFGFAVLNKMNDAQILDHLLSPSLKTFEHIKAKSAGGADKVNNGILLCAKCNRIRSSIPYEQFLEYHPLMPYYTQKQILQISDCILNGKLNSDFKYWPIEVASTLNENTGGRINPDISSYCKKGAKKLEKSIEERSEQMSALDKNIRKSMGTKHALLRKIKQIDEDVHISYKEKSKLDKSNTQDESLKEKMEEYLKNKK